MEYIKIVPKTGMLECRDDNGLDGDEAIECLSRFNWVTHSEALKVLSDLNAGNIHPDIGIYLTYENHPVLCIMSTTDNGIVGIAYDTCTTFSLDVLAGCYAKGGIRDAYDNK